MPRQLRQKDYSSAAKTDSPINDNKSARSGMRQRAVAEIAMTLIWSRVLKARLGVLKAHQKVWALVSKHLDIQWGKISPNSYIRD
jgi:hypothetical protein